MVSGSGIILVNETCEDNRMQRIAKILVFIIQVTLKAVVILAF